MTEVAETVYAQFDHYRDVEKNAHMAVCRRCSWKCLDEGIMPSKQTIRSAGAHLVEFHGWEYK